MFPFTTVLLIFLLLVLTVYLLHKVRNMHLLLHEFRDASRNDTVALFRQLEALKGLYLDLGLAKSLPATRGWAASPDFLAQLAQHALEEKPRTVVECSSGVTTLVLARCMQLNGAGKVYSLEHDEQYAEQTRAHLARHGLASFAEVVVAPLRALPIDAASWLWYTLDGLPKATPIDMLVIDGPPRAVGPLARYPAGPTLFHRLAPRATVFLDDAGRADELAILARWKSEFPALAQSKRDCEKGCAVLRAAQNVSPLPMNMSSSVSARD